MPDVRVNRWEVRETADGQWRARLVAAENGEVLVWSEAYRSRSDAHSLVERLRFPPERVEVVDLPLPPHAEDSSSKLDGLNDAVGVPEPDDEPWLFGTVE